MQGKDKQAIIYLVDGGYMDEFIKMIWQECLERFGRAMEVDIHIDSDGVTITTESKATTQKSFLVCDKKIDGSMILTLNS